MNVFQNLNIMNLPESFFEANCIAKDTIKGFSTYFCTVNGPSNFLTGIVFFHNGRYMISEDVYCSNKNKDVTQEIITKKLKGQIFTEEELTEGPIKSMNEFKRKEFYLKKLYPRQVNDGDYYREKHHAIFDPVNWMYYKAENKEFVNHHVWLYSELKKALRPSVFPKLSKNEPFVNRFETYMTFTPYADGDDPFLSDANLYLKKYSKKYVDEYYDKDSREFVLQLVRKGYLSKAGLNAALAKANDIGDTEMVAVIMEASKNSQGRSRFGL